MIDTDNEGFQSPKHEYNHEAEKPLITKCKIDQAKTILRSTKHSLEPDMIMGWKPKLPSCPLPLSYRNSYNQLLMQHIPKDDRYKIVYLGNRHANSVQVNQQYSYFWKYRQRYSLNLALVQQAVKNVGKQHSSFSQQITNSLTEKDLKFDSSFQSGNLELAVKVKPNEYDLFLRSDSNTKGHTNWYYFKVNNQSFTGTAQFNICNIGKTKTLYNKGMKPYIYEPVQQTNSEEKSIQKWTQQKTFDVCFVERVCRYGFDKKTFQLQFKFDFKKPNTEVYFAYGIPYTYSKLQKFVHQISKNHQDIVKCEKLCQSLGGLNIPLLTISSPDMFQPEKQKAQPFIHPSKSLSFDKNEKEQFPQENKNKRAVLITGRIHPGQSNASYVLEGFMRQLLKNDETSKKLRRMYTFYIIPMLNPDGVVVGNFRTSYSGKDLNRQFNKLNKYIYPEITAVDELATSLKQKYKKRLEFYLDFHGHSSKKNLFCYGPEYHPSNILFFKSRTFAKIIEEINPIFSYQKSVFQISEHKKTTARAHMLWNLKIPMTYTFEISNGLYDMKQERNIRLNEETLIQSGKAIFKGLSRYLALQTKNFGTISAKAKVDSGIRSRKISSQKNTREKNFKIHKVGFSRQSIDESRQTSLQKKSIQSVKQMAETEFDRYIRQIKKESIINTEPEGGSDSEGSQQDLSVEELDKLHEFVQSRSQSLSQHTINHFNFKVKTREKVKERKYSADEVEEWDKQNTQTQNINQDTNNKVRSINGVQTSRRLYQMSQKIKPLKKPPLPMISISTKYVLCQKKFTVDF